MLANLSGIGGFPRMLAKPGLGFYSRLITSTYCRREGLHDSDAIARPRRVAPLASIQPPILARICLQRDNPVGPAPDRSGNDPDATVPLGREGSCLRGPLAPSELSHDCNTRSRESGSRGSTIRL